MGTCTLCLETTRGDAAFHAACVRELFGTSQAPALDMDLNALDDLAATMVGRMSISGMQQKVSVRLSPDRRLLEVAPTGGRYILKPPSAIFPEIPQNEHLTMRLARRVGIPVPACGLVSLKDSGAAYIVSRFDRLDDGTKLQMEDFCQLAELPPGDKYDKPAELCVRLLRKYASEPPVAILSLYRLLVFSWCVGNHDLHLKNLSLLTGSDGIRRLSPAYDLVNTELVIKNDHMAMSVGGKTRAMDRKHWLDFADYSHIPPLAAERVLASIAESGQAMMPLIAGSTLSLPMKERYQMLLQTRLAQLTG